MKTNSYNTNAMTSAALHINRYSNYSNLLIFLKLVICWRYFLEFIEICDLKFCILKILIISQIFFYSSILNRKGVYPDNVKIRHASLEFQKKIDGHYFVSKLFRSTKYSSYLTFSPSCVVCLSKLSLVLYWYSMFQLTTCMWSTSQVFARKSHLFLASRLSAAPPRGNLLNKSGKMILQFFFIILMQLAFHRIFSFI